MEKGNEKISLKVQSNDSLMNAIRRYVMKIPVLAIDEVEIIKNDSPLYDETIAHRLGLIPIDSSKKIDDKKEIKVKLTSKKEGEILSKEIEGDIKFAYDNIPITVLSKGQELELKATIKKGEGEEHSKYTPGIIFYNEIINIKIDKNCPKEIISKCPKNIFQLDKDKIILENPEKCDLCEECIEYCKKIGKRDLIKLEPTNELNVIIESFGPIPPKDILNKSINILKKDLKELAKKV